MNSKGVSLRGGKGVVAYRGVKGRAGGGWCGNRTADNDCEYDEALHFKGGKREMTASRVKFWSEEVLKTGLLMGPRSLKYRYETVKSRGFQKGQYCTAFRKDC